MKNGNELIAELESQIEYKRAIQLDRNNRIVNHETDIYDCFLSINATSSAINEIKAKIKILKNGGVSTFQRLATLDGEIIEDSKIINGKYGECWLANGNFVNIPSFGCNAGKHIWINAGFKNHADARKQLMEEINTIEYKEKNNLYYTLGFAAQDAGLAKLGYKVVNVERPAWVTSKCGNSILHSYVHIFESDFNYFLGK